jgi:uncharacterized protein
MPLTRYLKVFDDISSGSKILYSAKKGSLISIPSAMLFEIKAGLISGGEGTALAKLGFLCEAEKAERKEVLGLIDEINSITRTFAAKVVINLDCNLACKYCFEGQRKGNFFMTKQTADCFIDFIKRWIASLDGRNGEEKIVITYYGGEPLLSTDLVSYLSKRIGRLAEDERIRYVGYIVTNGTILTPRVVEMLTPLGLKGAVVTLDGPREIHDSFRPFKGGTGSFDVIFRNLREVSAMLGLGIGGNFMSRNYREFPRLLDYMLDNGLTPEKIETVGFNPVTPESEGYGPADFSEGCLSFNEPWLFQASIYLREESLKRGFRVARSTLPSFCSLDMEANFLVNYDGSLYKCPGLIGREEFKVGDLRTGVVHKRQPQGRDAWKNDECLNCVYLPLCFGGCRYMKLIRDGNMNGVDCKKPYFDACLETLVKQDIKYGLTA